MAPTIILISGAGRGLGKGFAQRYLAKPDHIVIAANRDPESPSSKALHNLPKGEGSRLLIVKVDSTVEADAAEAVKTLAEQGINSLDMVVANAGIAQVHPAVSAVNMADLQAHLTTNVLGVLWLYRATLPMLRKSPAPKWVTMGSSAGSIQAMGTRGIHIYFGERLTRILINRDQPPIPNGIYGPSKAMVHWYTKRINAEEESVTAFVADPGWANTDMGSHGARLLGLERAPVDPDDSCDGLVKVIGEATKETHGGMFINYRGERQAW